MKSFHRLFIWFVFSSIFIIVSGCAFTKPGQNKPITQFYGNFCGAGHPKDVAGNIHIRLEALDKIPALDSIDYICKLHDMCYRLYENNLGWCDLNLIKVAQSATFQDADILEKCRNVSNAIASAFVVKPGSFRNIWHAVIIGSAKVLASPFAIAGGILSAAQLGSYKELAGECTDTHISNLRNELEFIFSTNIETISSIDPGEEIMANYFDIVGIEKGIVDNALFNRLVTTASFLNFTQNCVSNGVKESSCIKIGTLFSNNQDLGFLTIALYINFKTASNYYNLHFPELNIIRKELNLCKYGALELSRCYKELLERHWSAQNIYKELKEDLWGNQAIQIPAAERLSLL